MLLRVGASSCLEGADGSIGGHDAQCVVSPVSDLTYLSVA